MKVSNETKVGILTISALTILILGFNFLKGKDLFKKSRKIYAVFTDLGSLSKSNEVKINGYVIGSVFTLEAKDKDMTGIVATINLSQDVNIPVDSKALISSPLVGASYIVIEKGSSTEFLKPGDTLTTRVDVGILDDVKAQLTPTLTKVRSTLDTLDKVMGNVNKLLSANNQDAIAQTLANLNQASSHLNGLLNPTTGSLAQTLKNTEELTSSLKKNTDDINATVGNAKKASEKLAALEIQPTIDELNGTIKQFKGILSKMESKDGTLGALVNDRKLYDNLSNAVLSLEVLLDDLRTHPKRYVNLSIFGRKDKGGALTSPLPKDTVK
ncbi:MAG TPA: MlaD family protein [Chitinophagaceae bacterium]|nr:MlaD family protein [Chitinophagaceae bacterium]